MKKAIFYLFLIILIGAGLRLYELGTESLWADESYSLASANQPIIPEIIRAVNLNEWYNPPPYYILLHYWMGFLGDSEFALRFFSAIFGILSIPLIFLIGKEIFNPQSGLIGSLIFSLSVMEVLYSQEIRSYAFFSFLALASVYLFIKIVKNNQVIHYLLYTLFTLAMLYTLPFGFIVLFFQNLFVIFFYPEYRRMIKAWSFGQLCIFLFFIPEIPTFIKMLKKNYAGNFLLLVEKYGAPAVFKNHTFTLLMLISVLVVFIFLLFYFKTQIKSFLKNFQFEKYNYLFLFFLILAGGMYFYMTPILVRPIFLTRYSLFLMPFFYLFMAAGIAKFKVPIKTLVLLGIILLGAYTLLTYYPETTKEDWRGAARYVEQNSREDDLILFCGSGLAFKYYYSKDNEIVGLGKYRNISELAAKLKNRSYWFVFSPEHLKGDVCKMMANKKPAISQSYYRVKVRYFTDRRT